MTLASLQVPAMRGVMGDWVYYVTLLPFSEVATRIKRTDEIHTSKILREMIQRALTPRSKKIASYLNSQTQRFFNALVIGVYDGKPEWFCLNINKSNLFDPVNLENRVAESLGVLTLRGDEKLFAIDGQHRVEGIKEFAKELGEKKLNESEDEVCAIFVSHLNHSKGIQRTRRLFSTLNRYAKPVNLSEMIALDEDDIVAITCRDLLESHPLFKNSRISLEKKKSLAPNDKTNFTSLIALYQSMDIYLRDNKKSIWNDFKRIRPSDATTTQFIHKAHLFWNLLLKYLPELKVVAKLAIGQKLPNKFRSNNGGNILFRPISPPMIARCMVRAKSLGMSEHDFVIRLAKMPKDLQRPPWLKVLWDGKNMITSEKSQKVSDELILWMINCDPKQHVIKASNIIEKLSMVMNLSPSKIKLPKKIGGQR
jgi:DNA sulfur modification protein DndB